MSIWLTRSTRGRGLGLAAMAATLPQAAILGATDSRAETTTTNTGTLGMLCRLGFILRPVNDG